MHQRSDVPFGMFLSGGIDSSAVLALMARLNRRPVLAFTALFPGTGATDESLHARQVAKAVGAEHVEVPVTESDFWDLLPAIAPRWMTRSPIYAVVPTYKLAAAARGLGQSDSVGGRRRRTVRGYGRYRGAMRPWPFAKEMRRKGFLDGLDLLRDDGKGWRAGYAAAAKGLGQGHRTRLQSAQALDCADWLPNDLLIKLDRCLMANGVEGRVPFLDPKVAAFAYRLPDRQKVRGGLGKWLLRSWLEARAARGARLFAQARLHGCRSRNGSPDGRNWDGCWPGRSASGNSAGRTASRRCLRDPGKRTGFAAWLLLFYALWHRRHMEDRLPEGDVFATLRG